MIGNRRTASIPLARIAMDIETLGEARPRNVARDAGSADPTGSTALGGRSTTTFTSSRPGLPTVASEASAPDPRSLESFEQRTESFLAGSIDDASSTPQSFLSGKAATGRYVGPHRLGQAMSHGRSTHHRTTDPHTEPPAPPRFVPARFAPARPGSPRGRRGTRRRVTLPRPSRDITSVPVPKTGPLHDRGVRRLRAARAPDRSVRPPQGSGRRTPPHSSPSPMSTLEAQ
jgi:hypothetical protein